MLELVYGHPSSEKEITFYLIKASHFLKESGRAISQGELPDRRIWIKSEIFTIY